MSDAKWSPELVHRVGRAVKRIEAQPYNPALPPDALGRPSFPITNFIQTTGPISSGYYPCLLLTFDPDTQVFGTKAGSDAWAIAPDNNILAVPENYLARGMGIHQADGKPVWMVCYPPSSIAIVKITSGTPDGQGVYTCTVEAITTGAMFNTPAISDGAVCYLWDPNLPGALPTGAYFLAASQGFYVGGSGGGLLYVRDDFRLQWLTSSGTVNTDHVNQQEIGQGTNVATDDFIVTSPSARVAKIRTNGVNQDISVCFSDGTYHTIRIDDGLIKVVS